MASNLATIRVELIANAQKFKANLDKGKKSLKGLDKATKKSAKGGKKLQNGMRDLAGSIAAVQGPLGPVAGRISAIGAIMGRVSIIGLAFTAALIGMGIAFTKFVKTGSQAESQFLKLEALLKATGHAAGQTGTDIEAMSRQIGISTLASVQGARDAAGVLLTFKSIAGTTFKETLKLTQDLAAVGFGTMKTAALQLGKALEEPEIGLSALRRVGVSFNEQQKEQIKVLSMTGRQMEAQTLIIQALKDQVGGAGEGAAGGLSGAYDTLKERMVLYFEANALGAMIVRKLTDGLDFLNKKLENQIRLVRELPDSEEKLNERKQETLKIIHKEIDDLHKLLARKKNLNEFDVANLALLKQQIIVKKFDIKLNSKVLEDINKKKEMLAKEIPIVNKAQNEADKLGKKRERNVKREIEDLGATATQLRINNDLRKLEDKLISKLGEGKKAREAIVIILEKEKIAIETAAIANQKFIEEFKEIETIASNIGNEFQKVGDKVVDAFLRGKAGALDFKNILRELIISIQKTIIQTLILDQVNKFVKNTITGIFNPKAPKVGGRILAPGDGKAGGGTVQQGKPTLVGERGPELFVPQSAGSIRNNSDTKQNMGSGGGVSITQNLNFAVGVTNTVRAEVMNMLPAIQQSTINAVADAKQRGGKFSKAFGS